MNFSPKGFALAVTAMAATGVLSAEETETLPEVTVVTMTQVSHRRVVIDYTLAHAAAVVTLDIETNNAAGGWASIGGEHVRHITGDCWKKVAVGDHSIRWDPSVDWPDHKVADGGCRAVVKAWALDNTPDYMVVDISATATPGGQRYYPSIEFLPHDLFGENAPYRTTSLLMRKIMAKDVTWTMGSVGEAGRYSYETAHDVTLTNNYYIGVFPVTQTQWECVSSEASAYFLTERAMRPAGLVTFNAIRTGQAIQSEWSKGKVTGDDAYAWPADPNPASYLGLLRARTGIDFDLPSESQWEYACRAGNGEGYWGDGSPILDGTTDPNLGLLGRYSKNGGKPNGGDPDRSCDVTQGASIVGSYAPNAWGLYDMQGNVGEWCLDYWLEDITKLNGAVNCTKNDYHVVRGGYYLVDAKDCRPAVRAADHSKNANYGYRGFRLVCRAGLE